MGDCYFLSSLAAFATSSPQVLTNSAVDMGDGTYVVQFMSGTSPTYVRVNSDMPVGGFNGFNYAHPGTNNTIWAAVFEKAFCYYRAKANTYASINSGWMQEVYGDFGVNSSNVNMSQSQSSFYTLLSSELADGEAVTFGTFSGSPNLVNDHAYTLVSVYTDSTGATSSSAIRGEPRATLLRTPRDMPRSHMRRWSRILMAGRMRSGD